MSVGTYYITGGAALPVQASVNAFASAASLAAADTTLYNQATILRGGYWEWMKLAPPGARRPVRG